MTVVPMVASKNKGVPELLSEIVKIAEGKKSGGVKIAYGREVEKQIEVLEKALSETRLPVNIHRTGWR